MAQVALSIGCPAWAAALPDAAGLVEEVVRAALAGAAVGAEAEVSVRLTDDAEQRELNRAWRGRDSATNVLSFPAFEAGEIAAGAAAAPHPPALLGDVTLAFETVRREAGAAGKPLADHVRHLLAHGVLHLIGYDHRTEAEAAAMESLETEILARLGTPDPYGVKRRRRPSARRAAR